jgi:4-alpha-glucanotransferase
MTRVEHRALCRLATLYGAQIAYHDVARRRRHAGREALLVVLRALGAPVATGNDAISALRESEQMLWRRGVEPVAVAWDETSAEIEFRVPEDQASAPLVAYLSLATGDVQTWTIHPALLPSREVVDVEGIRYVSKRIRLPDPLPLGYHRLTLEIPGGLLNTMIISAPRKAFAPFGECADGKWGIFAPLYALHSRRSWGAGDFGDLEAVMDWVGGQGGSIVATLPLLAAFLDNPYEPSPYAPASRLFWNEFYLDIEQIPELKRCPSAMALLNSRDVQDEIRTLRTSALVDYRRQMSLKRRMLEELARYVYAESSERAAAFRHFVESHPTVDDYASFRSACERQKIPWPEWPRPLRDGVLRPEDYDETGRRYHVYAQWLVSEQLQRLSEKANQTHQKLYLDLPLGVHPHGYDVWRERAAFASEVRGGAPPDAVFTGGQNWGFPPLHPVRIREQGYRYVINYIGQQMKYAGILRIDHVMSLHRLFWIPNEMEPRDGVYVRYPAEELYAILSIESHKHKCVIVGENLGTVPSYVGPAMVRHNVQRMYVTQYELSPTPERPLRRVPLDSVASLNTHDMPTFAAFWQGLDIDDRRQLGLLDRKGAALERKTRKALKISLTRFLMREGRLGKAQRDLHSFLQACLAVLSSSAARALLVNLEDLWLETLPQNVPDTVEERPNWQRKTRYTFEELSAMSQVVESLREIDHLRKHWEGR